MSPPLLARSAPASMTSRDSRDAERVRRIRERFLHGDDEGLDGLREVVRRSWIRSRAHAVDPHLSAAPLVAPAQAPPAGREHASLHAAAEPVLRFLGDAFDRALVLLADAECRPIEVGGGGPALAQAAQINVVLGSQWSEDRVGTDALALSTLLEEPVEIRWSEHYSELGQRWSGSAAPIRHAGALLGTLSVYGYDEVAHPRALDLVQGCAAMIEARFAEGEVRGRLALLEAFEAQRARTPGDGLLCVTSTGVLAAASPGALELVGATLEDACGRRLDELPGVRIAEGLPGLERIERPCELRIETPRGGLRARLLPVGCDGAGAGFVVSLAGGRRPARPRAAGGWTTRFAFSDVVGESPAIREAVARARRFAKRDLPVLLVGESGTGKELFAQALHAASRRGAGPFVPLHCGGTSEDLLGTELFGYADGAFTGATRGGRAGKIELADGGTLFLDEVEDMPMRMQSHLLRVLEEGRVVRLGAERPRAVDVRVVAATKVDLADRVAEGRFRADLYHRLDVLELRLPPLRERGGDIGLLARHLLDRHGVAKPLGADAQAALAARPWPGNVRELRNALLQAAERSGATLAAADLAEARSGAGRPHAPAPQDLRAAEREVILATLRACHGNVSGAARRLGVHRVTLHRKMRRHGITAPRRPE